jgi:phytanoyl-CoA hydroxylase
MESPNLEYTPAAFARQGFVVLRGVIETALVRTVTQVVKDSLNPLVGPAEYEADVGYPGAPASRSDVGGTTPRRLLHAFARDDSFRQLACHPRLASELEKLLGGLPMLSQCHHNCVMTKHPGFSSETLWHQDIRYWSFDRPELISAWFALDRETPENGALQVIPGTHTMDFDRGRLDRDLFLRPELPDNAALIQQAQSVVLNAGDVLLFHCRLFHAAGRNTLNQVKLSPVFTYHREDNLPIPGTRSAAFPSIALASQVGRDS